MRKQFSLTTIACLPLLACGSDTHKITVVDGNGSGKVYMDAPPAACKAAASYSPTFGSNDSQSAQAGSAADAEKIGYLANITQANPIDLLDIEIWAGTTDFGSAAKTGTYDFAMHDNDKYLLCGACANVYPQVPVGSDGKLAFPTGYFDTETYVAKSGTITITAVGSAGSNFTGSLTNVVLKHTTFTGSGSATMENVAADGCMTTIPSVNFTATISAAALVGTTSDGKQIILHHRYR